MTDVTIMKITAARLMGMRSLPRDHLPFGVSFRTLWPRSRQRRTRRQRVKRRGLTWYEVRDLEHDDGRADNGIEDDVRSEI